MDKNDVSRAVLITGCSSGIGRATELRLVAAGWFVYATARRRESLTELDAAGCRTLALDVTDDGSMRNALAHIEAEVGTVGVLVNNAGYSQSGAIETLSSEALRRQFETNVFGAIRLAQLVLPGMRRQGWGKIVNISSIGGKLTFPGGGAYHGSKYALEALSDVLRIEVRGFGIDVIVIEPGLIRTGFAEAAVSAMEKGTHPYTLFNEAVAKGTREVYEKGSLARLGGSPGAVARTVEKAITAKRPRSRYPVTASAWLLLGLRALLPDRAWDAMQLRQFPQLRIV